MIDDLQCRIRWASSHKIKIVASKDNLLQIDQNENGFQIEIKRIELLLSLCSARLNKIVQIVLWGSISRTYFTIESFVAGEIGSVVREERRRIFKQIYDFL